MNDNFNMNQVFLNNLANNQMMMNNPMMMNNNMAMNYQLMLQNMNNPNFMNNNQMMMMMNNPNFMNNNQMMMMMNNPNFMNNNQMMMNNMPMQNMDFGNMNNQEGINNNANGGFNLIFTKDMKNYIIIANFNDPLGKVIGKYIDTTKDTNVNMYIFNGKKLNEGLTVGEAGLKDQSLINVVPTQNILGAIIYT